MIAMTPTVGLEQMPTGTVTFLMTDIEGSTRMWEAHGDVMGEVLARHEEMVGAAVAAHGGHRPLEQGEGDSAVAAFWRPADAIDAAVALQRALATDGWPDGAEPVVRMAIHTGEASIRSDGTYRGVALHRCARIRGLAHGGQVLVSELPARLVVDQLPLDVVLADLGQHRLRDLTRPERLFQVEAPGLRVDFPSLRSLDAVDHNLPVQMTSFVGRTEELGDLARLLDAHRIVTLAGAGGCGKTRLAVQAAADRAATVDAVWFVELAPVSDQGGVGAQVLRAAGLKDDLARSAVEVIAARVLDTSVLLVLDNCEHLIESCSRFVDEVLGTVPGVAVLATSREPLGVPGEVVCRVPSLPVPDPDDGASQAEDSEAVQLLIDRCRLVRPGFDPDEADLGHLAAICRRLDGIPLAIELAAARTRVLSPGEVARGLDDRFRLLAGGGRTALPRPQTLRASVDWSHTLLDDQERTVLRRLAVFSGGFTLDLAERVVASAEVEPYAVLDVVTRLVDKSLVLVDAEREPARFGMLETIRQYAEERLLDAGEAAVVRDRHAEAFAALTRRAAPGLDGPALDAWVQQLAVEHDNLLVALAWSMDGEDAGRVWEMVGDLTFFWASLGHFAEARRAFAWCLEHDSGVAASAQLAARWGAAHLAFYSGDYVDGLGLAADSLERAEVAGDDRYVARSLSTLGTLEMVTDPASAIDRTSRASAMAEVVGDLWCATDAGQIAGYTHLLCSRVDDALEWLDRTAPGARRLDNAQLLAWDVGGRAMAALHRGRIAEAEQLFGSALREARRTGDPNIVGNLTAWRCLGLAVAGEAMAADLARAARGEARRVGAGPAEMALDVVVTLILAMDGHLDEAESVFAETIDLLEAFVPLTGTRLLMVGADLALLRGDPAEAASRIDRGRALVPVGVAVDRAVLDRTAAMVEVERAAASGWPATTDLSGSERLAQQALEVLDGADLALERLDTLEVLGVIAGRRRQPVEAVRTWAARDAEAERIGLARTVVHRWAHRHRVEIQQDLAADVAETARSEGAALGLHELVAYVRRARGERRRPAFGWESLTPTESQVVELAAAGLSNRLIGEQLFISAGTVKVHLSHAYAKLDVANRTELAAEVARRRVP